MTRLKLSAVVLVSFVLSLLFVRPPAAAQEKKNLRIVFVSLSWNNQLPIRVAMTKGFFKDQGLTLEPIFVRGGPIAITALISGNVEFASVGGAQAPIRSNARGLDLHIISSMSNYTNYTLLGSKEPSGSTSRETTSILTKTPRSAPSAEPRCAPSPSKEALSPPPRFPLKIR